MTGPERTLRDELIRTLAAHRLTTPVQCICGWRETDPGAVAWDVHAADAVLPVVQAHLDAARADTAEAIAQAIERYKSTVLGTDVYALAQEVATGTAANIARHYAREHAATESPRS